MMQAWSGSAGFHGCSAARLCRVAATMIIISSYIVTARDENFEGNVHIVSDGSNKYEGVLQVYTHNQWNVVCYQYDNRETNRGAAAAACRQEGYTTVFYWGTAESMKYNETENLQDMAITAILCPEVQFVLSEGEIFLLRCDYELTPVPREACDGIVAVQCDNTRQHDTAYNGQVSLIDDGDRTELLVIRLEGEKLPICTSYLSKNSADSACRQMGFTESVISTLQPPHNSKSWKIHDLSECDKANTSLPCFTDCIDRSLGYTLVEECDENQYELFCKFDKTIDGVYSGGNQFICLFPTASSDVPLDFLAGLSSLLSAIIVGMAVLLLCICCCPLPNDNNDQNQRYYKALWRKFRRVHVPRPVNADQDGERQGLLEQQRQN